MKVKLTDKAKSRFWKMVHNGVAHPLMAGPWLTEPKWVIRFHDWTAEKAWGKP